MHWPPVCFGCGSCDGAAFQEGIMAGTRWTATGVAVLAVLILTPADRADEDTKPTEMLGRIVPVAVDTKRPERPVIGVDLSHSRITDEELKHLKEFKDLRTLNLSWNQFLTEAGLKELKELKSLQTLDLSYNLGVRDAWLKHLKGFQSLQSLNLRSTGITDAGLKALKELQSLRTLNVTDTNVTDAGVKELKQLRNLEPFHLRRPLTDARPTDLIPLKLLTKLSLST